MKFRFKHSLLTILLCLGVGMQTQLLHAQGWLWNMPPNTVWLDSGKRNNVFYVGQTVSLRPTVPGAVTYDVRDYWGNIVDQGSVGSTINPKVTQPGWYKVHLHGSTVQAPWGDSVGDAIFSIFRSNPNLPTEPAQNVSGGADPLLDMVMRGVAAIGPERHSVPDVNDPAGAITKLDAEIALAKQWYANTDSVRPRPLMIAFPNGTQQNLDGVRQIVAHFKNDVKYWEPRNEPNDIPGNQFAVNEMKPFYDAVKGVDPTAKVLGPGVVSLSLLPWIEQFLQGGGGQCIDAFSFHAYGNVNGDVWLARKCLDDLNTLLAKYGLQNIEKWQTEQGYFAASYGVYQPRLQGRWTMVQMMTYEQYGIPKEHNNYWYARSGGFWDFPTWWSNEDGSLNPGAALMRVWSEELYGKQFVKALDFGTPGNQLFIGSQFAGSGKQVYALMSAGMTDGVVELNVPGVSTIHVVSAFGVEQDVSVVNGKVSLQVPELPVYVETPATVTVTPINYGKNLALNTGVTASANSAGGAPPVSSANNPSLLINGFLESSYYGSNDVWRCDTQSFPAWVDIAFPTPTTMDHVLIYAAPPWSLRGSLLDYDLQYQNASGQWVTIQTVTEPTKTFQAYSPINRTNEDSFYSDRWIFQHSFAPITTQKLRVYVRDVTWGGDATLEALNTGGQGGDHQITLREIEVYNVGTSTSTAPLAPAATPDTAVTTTGTPVTINALANDSDPGNGPSPLSIQSVTTPGNGTAAIVNNQIVYTPKAGFNGSDSFNYAISNGTATATSSVTVIVTPPVGTGTGLKGDYFSGQTLTTLKLSRTDASVNFDWSSVAPDSSLGLTNYSVRWTGQVQPQYTETYTFTTSSDDGVRVWVNGQQLINNWTDHATTDNSGSIALVAGQKYDIKVEFYQNTGGAVAEICWSSPSQANQVIPSTQLYPAMATVTPPPVTTGTGTGLKGDYFSGQTLTTLKLSRTDATVNFDWSSVAPDASLGLTNYSVRWTGQVQPQYTETYTFTTSSDDGVRLWVNGQQLINNWTDHATTDNSGSIALAAGQKYDIKVEFYQNAGGAVAEICWSSPSQAKQVIPTTQLYPAVATPVANVAPVAVNDSASTNESTAVTINALANDSDSDNGPSALALTTVGKATNGTATPLSGKIAYTPNAGFVGTDSFAYTISDGSATATGTVTVTVNSTALATNLSSFGLSGTNVGTGSSGSSRILSDNSWELNSASGGIAGTSDAFHFESQAQSGDFQIVAKVNSLTSSSTNARAGVMIRESTASNARCVMIAATTGTQYRYAARTTSGGNATEATAADTYTFPNAWVMLQRVGDTITVTESSDDITYHQAGTYTLTGLPATVSVGLFSTSGLAGTNARAVITNYEVLPLAQSETTGQVPGLFGQYYNNSSSTPQLVLQRTDATVNFDWGTGSPDPSVPVDRYYIQWTGQVQPQSTETYTFYTETDDGVRLWVNGQQLINDWTDHAIDENSGSIALVAGKKYDIVMQYYESTGGAAAQLLWSSPSVTKQIIPQGCLFSSPTPVPGLKGDYFSDQTLTTLKLSRTDATVNFKWGTGSPNTLIPVDHFSVRWTGQVQAPVSGTYTFTTTSDDGVRLWVNGQQLVNNWTNHNVTNNSGKITLVAGQKYSIRMEYYDNTNGATAQLYWTPPGQSKQIVPSVMLSPQ